MDWTVQKVCTEREADYGHDLVYVTRLQFWEQDWVHSISIEATFSSKSTVTIF